MKKLENVLDIYKEIEKSNILLIIKENNVNNLVLSSIRKKIMKNGSIRRIKRRVLERMFLSKLGNGCFYILIINCFKYIPNEFRELIKNRSFVLIKCFIKHKAIENNLAEKGFILNHFEINGLIIIYLFEIIDLLVKVLYLIYESKKSI